MVQDLLHKNYFELFNLPIQFNINTKELKKIFLTLQKQYHPDNAVNLSEAEQQGFLACSSFINTAYNTLLSDKERAIYLLARYGVVVDLVYDTQFSHDFLFEQIELRERIGDANSDADALEEILDEVRLQQKTISAKLEQLFDNKDYNEIKEAIKKLAFYDKLAQLIKDQLNSID